MSKKSKYKRCPSLAKGYNYNNLYAKLPAEYKAALREIAHSENASMSWVCLTILVDWIHDKSRIRRPQFDKTSLKLVHSAQRKRA